MERGRINQERFGGKKKRRGKEEGGREEKRGIKNQLIEKEVRGEQKKTFCLEEKQT